MKNEEKTYIRRSVARLMKCMNYVSKKMDQKNALPIYYDIYQLLGYHAWTNICSVCSHEFRVSKKYPIGRCHICGTIRRKRDKENHI